jgi:hypothetical protein
VELSGLKKCNNHMFSLAFQHMLRIMHINPRSAGAAIAQDQTDLCESPIVRDAAA